MGDNSMGTTGSYTSRHPTVGMVYITSPDLLYPTPNQQLLVTPLQ